MDQIDKQLVRKNSKINDHLLEELDTVASATECTGLIPTPPLSESEAEAYTDIYTIPTRKAWRQCRQAFLVFKNCPNCL